MTVSCIILVQLNRGLEGGPEGEVAVLTWHNTGRRSQFLMGLIDDPVCNGVLPWGLAVQTRQVALRKVPATIAL